VGRGSGDVAGGEGGVGGAVQAGDVVRERAEGVSVVEERGRAGLWCELEVLVEGAGGEEERDVRAEAEGGVAEGEAREEGGGDAVAGREDGCAGGDEGRR
jgi:hypothetical protein